MDLNPNIWAVLASGVASMVLGFLWYGPLFGKPWAKEMGWGSLNSEQSQAMKKKAGVNYPQQFIGALLMAYIFGHVVLAFTKATGEPLTASHGLQGAFWMWLGFIVPLKYGEKLWGGKSLKLFFIDSLYYLVLLAVFGLILAYWK